MENVFSILIDSRSRFETGQPGGEWLTLPATAEQLHDAMRRVGITADNPRDFFINGFETRIEAATRLTLNNLKASSIDELNYLAAELSRLDTVEVETLNAASEVLGYWDDVHQLLEYAHNKEFHVLIPGVLTPLQLGNYYLNQTEMIQIPDEWAAAIDVEKLGQLAYEHERGQFTQRGYVVESGDQWEAVTDVPEEYRNELPAATHTSRPRKGRYGRSTGGDTHRRAARATPRYSSCSQCGKARRETKGNHRPLGAGHF